MRCRLRAASAAIPVVVEGVVCFMCCSMSSSSSTHIILTIALRCCILSTSLAILLRNVGMDISFKVVEIRSKAALKGTFETSSVVVCTNSIELVSPVNDPMNGTVV